MQHGNDTTTNTNTNTNTSTLFEMPEATLIDCMGSDLTVVNAARVSFNKQHDTMHDNDIALIEYLATHGHWSPFAHPQLSFRVKAPIFVARQLAKHQVGLSWNEVSRRYIDTPPTYSLPAPRQRAENVKQGSGKDIVPNAYNIMERATIEAHRAYNELLAMGVAPEAARAVLPLSMMTEWVWTGSLYAFARVCNQRLDKHAQAEASLVASYIYRHLYEKFPVSSYYLMDYTHENLLSQEDMDEYKALEATTRAAGMVA